MTELNDIELDDLDLTKAEDVQTFKQRILKKKPLCLPFTITELKEILFLIKHFEPSYKEFIAEGFPKNYPHIKSFEDFDLSKIVKSIFDDTRFKKVVENEFNHCVSTPEEIIKFLNVFNNLKGAIETIYDIFRTQDKTKNPSENGYVVFTKMTDHYNIPKNCTLH